MTETTESEAFARLAQAVYRRRRQLRLTQEHVRNMGGPSTATLRLIEAGKPTDFRRGTAEDLERVLVWMPGSINAILEGGEPRLGDWDPAAADTGFTKYVRDSQGTVGPSDQDDGILGSLPPGAVDGLDANEIEEVIAAAKLRALERAREIRRQRET